MQSRSVVFMVLSAFAFSIMSLLVKLGSARLPIGELVLARAVMTAGLSYAMLRRASISPWGTRHRALIVRGLFGSAALACYYLSLAWLPLADATTLNFTQPIMTALLAWWLLGERIGWAVGLALACGIGGVLLVVHPGTASGAHPGVPVASAAHPAYYAVALAAAVFSSFAYVTVRQLAKTEHPLVIVFYFPLVSMPLAIPWALYDWVWPSALDWLLLAGIGISTQVGQVYLTRALAIERAARAMSVGYAQIVFAVMWQLLVFGKQPGLGTLLGASLIIGGTLAVSATGTRAATAPRTAT
jgi:drug/metabolite transporter (DMT)-like permease